MYVRVPLVIIVVVVVYHGGVRRERERDGKVGQSKVRREKEKMYPSVFHYFFFFFFLHPGVCPNFLTSEDIRCKLYLVSAQCEEGGDKLNENL
jgi:hypothetical protein